MNRVLQFSQIIGEIMPLHPLQTVEIEALKCS